MSEDNSATLTTESPPPLLTPEILPDNPQTASVNSPTIPL